MKTLKNGLLKDVTLLIGIGLIILSAGIFFITDQIPITIASEIYIGIFALNYLISIIYFILLRVREFPKFKKVYFKQKIEYGFIHLILCFISAYSLNRQIHVFEQSSNWLQYFLVFQGVVLMLVFVKNRFPQWLQFIFWTLLGACFSLSLYLSFYLIPIYAFGFLGFFLLGVSLHTFIPLLLAITLLTYLFRNDNRKKGNIISFNIGIVISLLCTSFFLFQWNRVNNIITKASDSSIMDERNDLPEWTIIAKHLPKNTVSEKILKTDLVYSMASGWSNWDVFNVPNRNFDGEKKHDPLVMIATFLFGKPNLSTEQKIKILESMYDSRHQSQQRLWAGDALQTSHIISNIKLFPSLRIAYTEKIISIRNANPKYSRNQQQEAIYTFHLPEGAVVTSLSLWINEIEEKAILTSKHKADTAYKTIVGREVRDPSVVTWQEGNTVAVRVFPCTPSEDRRFKIGITSPLSKESASLTYDNIWFDGPLNIYADESIKVQLMDNVSDLRLPEQFQKETHNTYTYDGKYNADWRLTFPCIPIRQNDFVFNGHSYKIAEYLKTFKYFDPQTIYLDIDSEWTETEFEQIIQLNSGKNIFVFQNQLVKLTDGNAHEIFNQQKKINFSVFPFYLIDDPQNALIITKGHNNTPNLMDLTECEFSRKLNSYMQEKPNLHLFNINHEMSPYIKALKELRVFEYDFGTIDDLTKLINEKKFAHNQENSTNIVINHAGISISESNDSSTFSDAPDHLMRLFTYNNVLYNIGSHYFERDFFDTMIVEKAYKAYVVSPVTSLIVLETKQDYDRFGIKDDGASLKNASMQSSGAVPEPHEWLLIIVLIGVGGFLIIKKRRISTT